MYAMLVNVEINKIMSADTVLIVWLPIGHNVDGGTVHDIHVSNLVQQHRNDITIMFETARSENEAIKYYFKMEVEFYRTGPEEGDVQHTTARFYIPLMTSDADELNLPDIIAQFMEKI